MPMDIYKWKTIGLIAGFGVVVGCGEDTTTGSVSDSDADTTSAASSSSGEPPVVPTTSGSDDTSSGSASAGETMDDTTTDVDPSTSTTDVDPSTSTTEDDTSTSTTDTSDSSSSGNPGSCGDGMVDDGEECDDGDLNADDAACKSDCTANICGDGAVHAGVEACDDGNSDDGDGCNAECQLEFCGDGIVQDTLGEACDDGNNIDGDGCSSMCEIEVATLCAGGTIDMLINYGFETGEIAPWTSNGAPTITDFSHSGMWAAQTIGNFHVRQDFAATPVPTIVSASFWTWHDAADSPAMSVEWGYSDNTTGNTFYGAGQLNGWQNHDILALLAPNKSLTWLRVWGYSGGQNLPDITRYDDFALCRQP